MGKVQLLTGTGTATGTIHYNYVLQKIDCSVLSNRDATVQFEVIHVKKTFLFLNLFD